MAIHFFGQCVGNPWYRNPIQMCTCIHTYIHCTYMYIVLVCVQYLFLEVSSSKGVSVGEQVKDGMPNAVVFEVVH